MRTIQSFFCLLLFLSSPVASVAQNTETDAPKAPILFGKVAVKDGKFWVTEFKLGRRHEDQNYEVMVPIMETIVDKGTEKTVTRMIIERRTETVTISYLQANPHLVPDEAISFSTIAGKRVTNLKGVRKLLQKGSRPAAIKFDTGPLEAYYQNVLNPDLAVVVHIDQQTIEKYTKQYLDTGYSFMGEGDMAKAEENFRKAIELNPNNPRAYAARGDVYTKTDESAKAEKAYTKAIELDPYDSHAYMSRCNIFSKANEWAKAEKDISKAIELAPKLSYAYVERGLLFVAKKEWAKAEKDLLKANELNASHYYTYQGWGIFFLGKEEWAKAEEILSKALEQFSSDARTHVHRATARMKLENWEGAVQDFSQALILEKTLVPSIVEARANALKKLAESDPEKAKEVEKGISDSGN